MRINPLEYRSQLAKLMRHSIACPSKETILLTLAACAIAATLLHGEAAGLSKRNVLLIGTGIYWTLYQHILKPTSDKLTIQSDIENHLELGKKATETRGWVYPSVMARAL